MPILKQDELDVISHSAEQTGRLGARLGSLLQPGDIICLSGEMGAGKTVFSRGIGAGWGALIPISSPTYTLVHQHVRSRDTEILYHVDCYRLESEQDVESAGLDDILSRSATIILEWPEQIESFLPGEHLWVTLRHLEGNRRNLLFEGRGRRYEQLLEQFRGVSYGAS
ncbi:MAG: tRNA (adenosine(37)-N6)-threonylcarbamoyltransferase complex ATPase subunit type 1 TsaE [Anaerolineae bacterium]|nr:tRNA (adenosine(37)-N6)-threonylcarbamoyltransferase complex ATPase subunit type 1 TsaE [Anaerolineae bacterium]